MTKKEVVIFLSYARNDQDTVKLVYKKLQVEGYSPWMDQYDILPGENWENCIKNAIKKASFFLIFLSDHSVSRRGVLQKEVRAALVSETGMLSTDIYLIPVRISDCPMPDELSSFQWVDLFDESGWGRLLSAIKVGLKRRKSDPRYKMSVFTSSNKKETK